MAEGDRPRDYLGRPLGHMDDPARAVDGIADITGMSDADVWQLAVRYADDGLPFHAHEVCEARWRTCAQGDRALWKALAQWGAALTQHARGNAYGAKVIAQRCVTTLDEAAVPGWLDLELVYLDCARLVEQRAD